jgi:hypothetical protein
VIFENVMLNYLDFERSRKECMNVDIIIMNLYIEMEYCNLFHDLAVSI